jgi:VWFA-related protein
MTPRTPRLSWIAVLFGAATATAVAQTPVSPPQTPQAQAPVFKAGIDAVLVDVEVLSGGHAVAGLTSADFTLTDNGVPQTVEASLTQNVPIDITLLIDTSGSVEGKRLERLKNGVRDTAHWLRPDDRWRVISVEHVLHEVVPLQAAGKPTMIDALQPGGGTALYDGLVASLMHPREPGRRQMLVVYTDGDDASSIVSPAAMIDVARLSDSVVHVVVPVENAASKAQVGGAPLPRDRSPDQLVDTAVTKGGIAPASGQMFPNEDTFTDLTARTGGRVFVVDYNDSLSTAFKRVIDEFRTGYLLQYTRDNVPTEGWHDLVVKVKRSSRYDVRARKGYWGG